MGVVGAGSGLQRKRQDFSALLFASLTSHSHPAPSIRKLWPEAGTWAQPCLGPDLRHLRGMRKSSPRRSRNRSRARKHKGRCLHPTPGTCS